MYVDLTSLAFNYWTYSNFISQLLDLCVVQIVVCCLGASRSGQPDPVSCEICSKSRAKISVVYAAELRALHKRHNIIKVTKGY